MTLARSSWPLRLAGLCVVQALLVAGAVWPQLSARLSGHEVLLEVAPVDPIDPFRGAYVRLGYAGLPQGTEHPLPDGTVFVPLERAGELWTGAGPRRRAPEQGPYLRCDSDGWSLRCGIESLFLPQDEAQRLERELLDGAVARVRVDGRGNAALVAVEPQP
jgi:uncharacterized membrane-anchored protein